MSNQEEKTQNLFSKFTSITEKKEYMQRRLKLENSYILFFAYNDSLNPKEKESEEENTNSEWADFFNEISQSEINKHLEIITVIKLTQNNKN